jgi:hypothetical protein
VCVIDCFALFLGPFHIFGLGAERGKDAGVITIILAFSMERWAPPALSLKQFWMKCPFPLPINLHQAHILSHSPTCKILPLAISQYILLPAHVPSYRILWGAFSFERLAVFENAQKLMGLNKQS